MVSTKNDVQQALPSLFIHGIHPKEPGQGAGAEGDTESGSAGAGRALGVGFGVVARPCPWWGHPPLPLILGENPSPGGEIPGAAGREAWKRTA